MPAGIEDIHAAMQNKKPSRKPKSPFGACTPYAGSGMLEMASAFPGIPVLMTANFFDLHSGRRAIRLRPVLADCVRA